MRINAAYKEALKKILETGDMSRVKYEVVKNVGGVRLALFWIQPTSGECTDSIVEGAYYLAPRRFANMAAEKRRLAAQVSDAIKKFLSRAEEAQED